MMAKPSYRWAHLVAFGSLLIGAVGLSQPSDAVISAGGYPKTLSEFGFFDDGNGLKPNDALISYSLNTPLFSDHTEKSRYIYIPDGKVAEVMDNGLIDFPEGSAIIKNFGYTRNDKMHLIETRVLLRQKTDWLALPYVWNETQDEAVLKLAGKRLKVSFTDKAGTAHTLNYAVPNKNQCKECHGVDNAVMPIGPKIRNLTSDSLEYLLASQKLQYSGRAETKAVWEVSASDLERDARAYLDINCGHCHNAQGSASNSGLFLNYEESDAVAYGKYKRPVAAGRGSGGLKFAIDPGSADTSIIVHRMKSSEADVAMPQIGRSITHGEGIALISKWIDAMPDEKSIQK